MKRLSIAISGINAVDNPGPGYGVARSLRADPSLDLHVIGLAYDALEPGIYLDHIFDRNFLMPYVTAGSDALLERLLDIHARHGLDLVIPCLDSELPLYSRIAESLARHGIRVVMPTAAQLRLRGKDRLPQLAQELGCSSPVTEIITSPMQMESAIAAIGLPMMVKGSLYEAWYASTTSEVHTHATRIAAEWGYPLLLQRMVHGEALNLVGVGDGAGGDLGMVTLAKWSLTKLGKVWTGCTVRHPGMLALAKRFLAHTHWHGPFELECLVSRDDSTNQETVYCIEINPRFPAWCHAAAGVGVNLPARLVRHALGEPCERSSDYPAGKLFIRYTSDLITDLDAYRSLVTTGADR
jgi:carbamoyl-phosphate synthase large subunit